MRFSDQLSFLFSFTPAPTSPPLKRTVPATAGAQTRDRALEAQAQEILRAAGASALIPVVQVEWNARLRSAAGRAHYHRQLVSLNPRLREFGAAEIDRTLRHELAHLVAHLRAGRRRISPHGPEWRLACRDLGVGDEQRCHSLPFPVRRRPPRFLYKCCACGRDFPRVRRLRRRTACLACCRSHNRGRYDGRFMLRLVAPPDSVKFFTQIAV